ncbi:MAG: xanthine dehydrogenase family protein molybdopterin-binding subunit [Steroidobacterales bacterium]
MAIAVPLKSPGHLIGTDRRQTGLPLARAEDAAILKGAVHYLADIRLPGCLHAAFARSPVARARIRHLSVDAAASIDGVHLVLTGADIADLGCLSVSPTTLLRGPLSGALLATDRLSAVGHAYAMVVAESAQAAQQALQAIDIDYETEEAIVGASAALAAAPVLKDWTDNIAFENSVRRGDVDAAFAGAACIIDERITMPRVAPLAMETRGGLCDWDAAAGLLTCWTPAQTPHTGQRELSRLLQLPEATIRVRNPKVGGSFGSKAAIYPEDVLLALASRRLGRPVRWIASRNEDLLCTAHGRGTELSASAAFDAHGRLLGLRAQGLFPIGHWATFGAGIPCWNFARILPGPYAVDAVDVCSRALFTNTPPVGIYRGAGRPEAALLMERLMDRAAGKLGMSPAAIRRTNIIRHNAFPFATPSGAAVDSANLEQLLSVALEGPQFRALRAARDERRRLGELCGIGISLYLEPCGQGLECATATRAADGSVTIRSGSSSQGQGHATAFAQIAADALGVPIGSIHVIEGDTRGVPDGRGAVASRSIAIGGSAVRQAAEQLALRIAATPDRGAELTVSCQYHAANEAWSSGCCVALVSIDRDTGVLRVDKVFWVDDAGLIINPLLAQGQLLGGLAQGIGSVTCEHLVFDPDGQLLSGSLMDYAIPRASDMPQIEFASLATPTDANALSAKGVGESGCIALPPAVLNAAYDALQACGIGQVELPLSAPLLWRLLRDAAAGSAA